MIFICFSSVNAQGEQICFEDLSEKIEAYYGNLDRYAFDVNYAFYSDGNDPELLEQMDGEIQKNKKAYYSKMGPTELVYFSDAFLKINHDEKAVFFSNQVVEQQNSPVAISSLLSYFEDTQVEKKDNRYICTLLFKKIDALPYSKMILEIDAATYQIYVQELYMIAGKSYPAMTSGNQKTTTGKMVTTFSKNKGTISSSLFNKSNYFSGKNDIALSGKIKAYNLYN